MVQWLFHETVVVRHAGQCVRDDTIRNGPLAVSTATLQAVSGWFELHQTHQPSWAGMPDRIRHFCHPGIITRVALMDVGKELRGGDGVGYPEWLEPRAGR